MTKLIAAIRIFCPSVLTQETLSGIYTSGGATEIRVSEDAFSGTALAYTPGMIVKSGIGAISQGLDLRRGGGIAEYTGGDIILQNATDLYRATLGQGVSLQGCRMEIHEFEGSDTAGYTDTTVFTGICDAIEWDGTVLRIKTTTSRKRRNAMVGSIIDNGQYADLSQVEAEILAGNPRGNYPYANSDQNGEIVPCTFGRFDFDGTTGAPAKLLRTASAVVPLTINGTAGRLSTLLSLPTDATQYRYVYDTAPDYGDVQDFPVYGKAPDSPVCDYCIKIGDGGHWEKWTAATGWETFSSSDPAIELTALAGMYLTAIDGTQSGNGRLIKAAYFTTTGLVGTYGGGSSDVGVIDIKLSDTNIFTTDNGDEEDLQANHTATPVTNDTWVQIQTKHQDYKSDEWPGAGWL